MIITRENERLYLSSWNYNAAQILTELAKIVINNGGNVAPTKTAIISNRSIDEVIHENENRINRIIERRNNGKKVNDAIIAELTAENEAIKGINNEPITVTHLTYINFTIDGVYYSYYVDDNPFFPFHIYKTPIKDGKRSADAAGVEDEKKWITNDCFYKMNCSKSDIVEAANLIYNMLITSNNSPIIRNSRRQRVPNTYNNGYHYETIYSKERFVDVDF